MLPQRGRKKGKKRRKREDEVKAGERA